MLTDEELTARLEAAFHQTAPELTYAGRVPHVRRTGGLAAASVLTAATALALAPAALERDHTTSPGAPSATRPTAGAGHQVVRTLDLGGLRFTYAEIDGRPGQLYLVIGDDLGVPPDAERADIDAAGGAEVWFAHEPAKGEVQVYVKPRGSAMVYGMYGIGWTRDQLTFLLEHPLAAQHGRD